MAAVLKRVLEPQERTTKAPQQAFARVATLESDPHASYYDRKAERREPLGAASFLLLIGTFAGLLAFELVAGLLR